MSSTNLNKFLASLQAYRSGIDTFNPWSDYDPIYDQSPNAPLIRRTQLKEYLHCRIHKVKYVLIAEAVGYQGGKFSGIPMTSERILLGNQPDIAPDIVLPNFTPQRTSSPKAASSKTVREQGYAEPTATIVWGLLQKLPLSPLEIILWNIFPFHPFKPEKGGLTNRTPKEQELENGLEFFRQLIALCPPNIQIIAIGEKSASTLGPDCQKVRHPANGGANQFREQLPPLLIDSPSA